MTDGLTRRDCTEASGAEKRSGPSAFSRLDRGAGSLRCESYWLGLPLCDRRALWLGPQGACLCGTCKRTLEQA